MAGVTSTPAAQQTLVTLDLEGVLVPEIWIEPDYDVLMRGRLAILAEHGLTMSTIADVIGTLTPMDGAKAFLDELRQRTQVIILSDTFEQFGAPLMRQLGMPTILCHQLIVADDHIVDYRLRMPDQKRHAVEAFRALNYRVVSAGDSYNDSAMLAAAHAGFWFHAPETIQSQFPQFPATDTYAELYDAITAALWV
jgi:phosphoserine/homoserine phosphotransferase